MTLRVRDVTYEYAAGTPVAQPALSEVSLDLEMGELAVLTGATGSGKTTLLRIAAGLLSPTTGFVELDGQRVAGMRDFRGTVGMAFQRPEAQFFAPTVLEDVAFGPRNLGRSDQDALGDARSALESVGLDPSEFGERSPFTLSGGEARRAALAGVLALRPSYLLLDEPTAGLDGPGRKAVLDALRDLRNSAGVLVVTHEADDLLPDTDLVVVLRAGECVFGGPVSEMLVHCGQLEIGAGDCPSEIARTQALAGRCFTLAGSPVLDPAAAATRLAAARTRR